MSDASEDAILGALEGAFGDAPPPKPAAAPTPAPVAAPEGGNKLLPGEPEPIPLPDEAEAADVAAAAEPAPEPEFEIEVNGQKEIVRGAEQIKQELQKARALGARDEEIARAREALAVQAKMQQDSSAFQQQVMGDFAQLKAIDEHLAQFNGYDWSKAIDTDFTTAMKLQEMRAQLRDQRAQVLAQIQQKHGQFQREQEQSQQQLFESERKALLAKVPEWRDDKRAAAEKEKIIESLYLAGFQPSEIKGLMDHRALVIARKAMMWDQLQATKTQSLKQVRDAPPVNKPGAAPAQAQQNQRASYAKFTQQFKQAGKQGNHRAQEQALEKLLGRAFK